MDQLRIQNLQAIMRPEDSALTSGLKRLIQTHLTDQTEMVEIGSFAGSSALMFAKKVKIITCIDPWTTESLQHPDWPIIDAEKCFDLTAGKLPNVQKLKLFSLEARHLFQDKSLDFVYIDGMHDYSSVYCDICAWLPKVKDGGLIGGHDFSDAFPDVPRAVREVFETFRTYEDTSWITEKTFARNRT